MRQADFLAEDNACGQSLLKLTSRGNAIIAELLRLSEFVPPIFIKLDNKYAELIYDFSYFKIADQLETKLESNDVRWNLIENLENFPLKNFRLTIFSVCQIWMKKFEKILSKF